MSKSIRIALSLLAAWAALAAPAAAKDPQAPAQRVERRIITFKPSVTLAVQLDIVGGFGGTVVHRLGIINAIAAKFQSARARAADMGLQARPEVLRVEEDFEQKWIEFSAPTLADVKLPSVESVVKPLRLPRRFSAVDPEVPWGIARVNAPAGWAVTRGAGVKVAVIDTGIDYDHPELKSNIKGGWNATDASKPDDFKDYNGHGTHVSGTIAAAQNSTGVVGVAPQSDLYGVRVLDAGGSGTFADIIAGIDWAVSRKMPLANMSLGASRGSDALAAAVQAAAKAGTVIIAAAGNSGGVVAFPAAYPEVIAVSAIDNRDKLARFSSRGPQIAFAAPGVDVYSTYKDGEFSTLSGTSMACPHMVGLAALAVAAKGVDGVEQVRAALTAAATPLPGLKPTDQGAGLVDAAKLVQ